MRCQEDSNWLWATWPPEKILLMHDSNPRSSSEELARLGVAWCHQQHRWPRDGERGRPPARPFPRFHGNRRGLAAVRRVPSPSADAHGPSGSRCDRAGDTMPCHLRSSTGINWQPPTVGTASPVCEGNGVEFPVRREISGGPARHNCEESPVRLLCARSSRAGRLVDVIGMDALEPCEMEVEVEVDSAWGADSRTRVDPRSPRHFVGVAIRRAGSPQGDPLRRWVSRGSRRCRPGGGAGRGRSGCGGTEAGRRQAEGSPRGGRTRRPRPGPRAGRAARRSSSGCPG